MALQMANHPERFFNFGGLPVRIERDTDKRIKTRELDEYRMRYEVARAAEWFKLNKKQEPEPGKPSRDHVHDVLATPEPPLPILWRITDTPIFTRDAVLIS